MAMARDDGGHFVSVGLLVHSSLQWKQRKSNPNAKCQGNGLCCGCWEHEFLGLELALMKYRRAKCNYIQ